MAEESFYLNDNVDLFAETALTDDWLFSKYMIINLFREIW